MWFSLKLEPALLEQNPRDPVVIHVREAALSLRGLIIIAISFQGNMIRERELTCKVGEVGCRDDRVCMFRDLTLGEVIPNG
jgi:hypothetical protein